MKTAGLLLLLLFAASAAADDDGQIIRSSMGGDIDVASAPRGAVLRTMGGDITVDHARGRVVAKTMGGNIRVRDLVGSLSAGTMGGDIDAEIAGATGDALFEIHTMGGHVEVSFPASFSGTFEVELEQSGDGPEHRIISDFPLKIRTSMRDRWFRSDVPVLRAAGKTGSGDARVRITTVGSDIVIRRTR